MLLRLLGKGRKKEQLHIEGPLRSLSFTWVGQQLGIKKKCGVWGVEDKGVGLGRLSA